MKDEQDDALELIQCAQINLQNLGDMMPAMRKAVPYVALKMQLDLAERALQQKGN